MMTITIAKIPPNGAVAKTNQIQFPSPVILDIIIGAAAIIGVIARKQLRRILIDLFFPLRKKAGM